MESSTRVPQYIGLFLNSIKNTDEFKKYISVIVLNGGNYIGMNEEEYRIKYIYTGEEIIGFEIKQKNIRRYYIYEKDLEHNIVGLYEMGD